MNKKILFSIFILSFFAIASLLFYLTSSLINKSEEQTQKFLLSIARSVALSVNVDDVRVVKAIDNSIVTVKNKERVAKQLRRFKDIHPEIRFIYLMGKINEQVVFLVDAEISGTENYSPTGSEYLDASSKLKNIFQNGIGFVEGPIEDKWGSWVSAHAPIFDESTGNIIAVTGVDIDAGNWNQLQLIIKSNFLTICSIILVMLFLNFRLLCAYKGFQKPNQGNIIATIQPVIDVKPTVQGLQKDELTKKEVQQLPIELNVRAETSYKNIIAALLDCIDGNIIEVKQHPSIKNQSHLIEIISNQYAGYPGLSKRNLAGKFAEAKKNLLKS